MSKLFTVLLMIFLHIIDDYHLQGILANMKQKKWWQDNEIGAKPLYRFDYIAALVTHSFSWSFMIMLPIAWRMNFHPSPLFFVLFFVNLAIHAFVDDLKANKLRINLVTDQIIHIAQIIVTALVLLS